MKPYLSNNPMVAGAVKAAAARIDQMSAVEREGGWAAPEGLELSAHMRTVLEALYSGLATNSHDVIYEGVAMLVRAEIWQRRHERDISKLLASAPAE